jgi:predicted flap endonuclease-1-like 5' DNA nuclease
MSDASDLPSIGRPARAALEAAGVTRLADLASWTERDVLALHGVGPKAVGLLREPMAAAGIAFAE